MRLVKRAVLASELERALHEEMQLGEMITVLHAVHFLDEGRLRQLRVERIVAHRRAMRLHEALRNLDELSDEPGSIAIA